MIVIDSSALVAILNAETERVAFLQIIEGAGGCLASTVTLIESRMVVRGRFGVAAILKLEALIGEIQLTIIPFDVIQADAAFLAFQTYGKGMHARAKLNLGDCASYALAKVRGLPLLYKVADFAATDIVSAA